MPPGVSAMVSLSEKTDTGMITKDDLGQNAEDCLGVYWTFLLSEPRREVGYQLLSELSGQGEMSICSFVTVMSL